MLVWTPGKPCWVRDQLRAYTEGTVLSVKDKKATVTILGPDVPAGTRRECNVADLLPRDKEKVCVGEMDHLESLHMASVLNNVEALFGQVVSVPCARPNAIYSSVGPVLIGMNPFCELPLYSDLWKEAYRSEDPRLAPHCYRTAQEAFSRLKEVERQSIVICGESGAGKTVTNRKMIEYLCTSEASSGTHPEQITEANVLLESFGNAKTTRNDNSSRFGKYTKLNFDPHQNYGISGCSVEHYLLERSRVCTQPPGERNYHVFYQFVRSGEGATYGVSDRPECYTYTRDGAGITGYDDAGDFKELMQSMARAGMGDRVRQEIMGGVAAVLHLGEVDFTGDKDSCKLVPSPNFDHACTLLGVDKAAFSKALTSCTITPPGGGRISKDVGVETARGQKDTVAKTIYSRLFDQIVGVINMNLKRRKSLAPGPEKIAMVGLLDIFGFEDMATNGFEQMFINLTNERIQHLFNSIMFEREMKLYKSEGIDPPMEFDAGNIDCVKLFTSPSKPPGIVKLLGESTMMKNGRDGAAFVAVLNTSFASHPCFKVSDPQDVQRVIKAKALRGSRLDYRECFQVKHFAGTVMYTVKDWVPKSMDALLQHLSEVLTKSTRSNIQELFDQEGAGKSTVGEKFVKQLEVLAATLDQGETRFVRCIKSNPQMKPGAVNRPLVLEQLINGGVIAALEMRARGLPNRMDYQSFCETFQSIEERCHRKKGERMRTELLVQSIFKSGFAFGHTRVFMQSHVSSFLTSLATTRFRLIANKVYRRWLLFIGVQRIRKVEKFVRALAASRELAADHGISELPMMMQRFREASAICEAESALREARLVHGDDVKKISACLPVVDFYQVQTNVDTHIKKVLERRNVAEQLFASYLTRAVNIGLSLLDRVITLEKQCADLQDVVCEEDLGKVMKGCTLARHRLEAFQYSEIVSLKERGPQGIDLEDEAALFADENVCPEANAFLAEGTQFVIRAEELGNEVLSVRLKFLEAVLEFQCVQDTARKRLEELQDPVRRCLAENISGIADKVNAAWQRDAECQDIIKGARDKDGYRAAVEAFEAATNLAVQVVRDAAAILEKREAERKEREAIQAQLDMLPQKVEEWRVANLKRAEKELGLRQAAQTFADLDKLQMEFGALRDARNDELADWRGKVDDAAKRTAEVLQSIDDRIKETVKKRRDDFKKRFGVFEAAAPKEEAMMPDPAAFIGSSGLDHHEKRLMEISDLLLALRDDGAPRSSVNRCLAHFVKYHFGATRASVDSPAPGHNHA